LWQTWNNEIAGKDGYQAWIQENYASEKIEAASGIKVRVSETKGGKEISTGTLSDGNVSVSIPKVIDSAWFDFLAADGTSIHGIGINFKDSKPVAQTFVIWLEKKIEGEGEQK
jgi:hypothetical protein